MDDAKIDSLAREVLSSLKKAHAEKKPGADTEAPPARVQATEPRHPSLGVLSVQGGVVGTPCIIEPDKLCVASLRCRSFGH